MVLHPHLSIFNIVLHYIEDFLSIWDAHDFKLRVPELDREEDIILPGDDDSAFVDWALKPTLSLERKTNSVAFHTLSIFG